MLDYIFEPALYILVPAFVFYVIYTLLSMFLGWPSIPQLFREIWSGL